MTAAQTSAGDLLDRMAEALRRVETDWTHHDGGAFEDGEFTAMDMVRACLAEYDAANKRSEVGNP